MVEIVDVLFDVRVDDQVFFFFGYKVVGLVVYGLNMCVEYFYCFNERYFEMQIWFINQRFVVIVMQYFIKMQCNIVFIFFDDKDRYVKYYQYDDDNCDN